MLRLFLCTNYVQLIQYYLYMTAVWSSLVILNISFHFKANLIIFFCTWELQLVNGRCHFFFVLPPSSLRPVIMLRKMYQIVMEPISGLAICRIRYVCCFFHGMTVTAKSSLRTIIINSSCIFRKGRPAFFSVLTQDVA